MYSFNHYAMGFSKYVVLKNIYKTDIFNKSAFANRKLIVIYFFW